MELRAILDVKLGRIYWISELAYHKACIIWKNHNKDSRNYFLGSLTNHPEDIDTGYIDWCPVKQTFIGKIC